MESLNAIFEQEYAAQIGQLYRVFSDSFLIANSEEQKEEAKKRFKAGLRYAAEVYNLANELSES